MESLSKIMNLTLFCICFLFYACTELKHIRRFGPFIIIMGNPVSCSCRRGTRNDFYSSEFLTVSNTSMTKP